MSQRLTWKKEPSETGLARVCQPPRGYDLRLNDEEVGHVQPWIEGYGNRDVKGWYWYASSQDSLVPHRNTCNEPVPTMEEAKDACERYVRDCLGLPLPARLKESE